MRIGKLALTPSLDAALTAHDPAPTAWARQPGESAASFARFEAFLQAGPDRSLAGVARVYGVSRAAIHQQASKYGWDQRAAAYDAAHLPEAALPAVLAPVVAHPTEDLGAEHLAALEEYRLEAERLGKAHARLARGLTQAASKNAARLIASDKPLSPRDVAHLATTAAALTSNGLATWGRAIGVDLVLRRMRADIETQVELID